MPRTTARLLLLALLAAGCAANPVPGDGAAGEDSGPGDFDAGPGDVDAGEEMDGGGGADGGEVDGGRAMDAGPSGPCGDGTLQAGETCDPGIDACCSATCDGPAAMGTECRASAGVCDVAEVCDGSSTACPADAFESPSTECRASAGPCDVPESCDGASAACPANSFSPAMTVCRASMGGCDSAEVCDGVSAACPMDTGSGAPPNVGLYAADDAAAHTTVAGFLNGTGMLGTVTIGGPVTSSSTPSLSELMAYDAVFVWGSASWDGTAMGNVLADYIDNGGGVVIAVFAQRSSPTVGVAGRMASAGYLAYVPASHGVDSLTLGTISVPGHPIMNGVTSLSGGAFQFHDGTHAPAATLVASMSNGRPLVAVLEPSMGRSTLLGFYPVRLWDTSTDGARLMANSLLWAAGCL